MTKPLTQSRGVVFAASSDLDKAKAISALLVRPIDLLPKAVGDPIRPFAIGIWNDIRALLKPNTAVTSLRRAVSVYTHSKRYYLACAQPDAFRHDIDGNSIAPVEEENRIAAQLAFSKLTKSVSDIPTPPPEPTIEPPEISRSAQIRAGLLGRSKSKATQPTPSSAQ
ncbi:ProQ/FINO family protein [Agrobacterium rhizogenes]|uniref:ProQ/FINO family protein n=1 Tax=Rhizobium rhizogenes TaxID=359 RepID=UPI0015730EB7|nr:ProQ/FINO family protein [Rhizobium rhizogenes]NTF52718.1 ProQ/FINO family protein [Rhizobium rhizogenes]NTG18234.1 ProQ/FINO family protein [Rhizobium rhizogenes]NTI06485.1 ProQ/FINO family protein [Rhizobium rhizogenes]NTI13296.1 ProQ/FINO family protein [Rhizobium rhizogenes]NTI91379.1 ProQ/FINO family protein [Rhizobium rhizogenes]